MFLTISAAAAAVVAVAVIYGASALLSCYFCDIHSFFLSLQMMRPFTVQSRAYKHFKNDFVA